MASAQLAAEEELQQSVVVSEEDLERDDSDSSNAAMLPYQNQDDTSEPLRTGSGNQLYLHVNGLEDLTIERHGGPTATLVSKNAESVEDDAEGEEDAPGEDDGAADAEEIVNPYDENDAEGEEDVEHVVQLNMDQDEGVGEAVEQSTGSVQSGDDEDDNDDEGVGAVKIRPGDTDDEDDVDSEQSHSTTDGSEDSDGAAAWEDAPESHEDEDEESDAAGRTLCLFCKQDEEHDPGEDFEDYLMCSHCGENSHQFCARETGALRSHDDASLWSSDTSRTLPTNDDRRRFDEAKQKAEEEWRTMHVIQISREGAEKAKKGKKAAGPASQIECIEFGGWEIDTWYAAPYPEEYSRNRILYICEFCLKYMNSDYVAWRHKLKCPAKHPPGDEIYRHGSVSVFEVDGRKNPVYCQNLCLLAKLFLGSKTLYYDVEPFLFYVLCEYDDLGYHFVGYFSKEKRASSQNNVSCILTLPIHQRKGYGNLLIDFSYLLTRVEKKTGSPEKPLSDMGLVSYRNYWRLVMCQYLLKRWDGGGEDQGSPVGLSFRQISDDTGLTPDDVISALEGLRCLIRDAKTGLYAFRLDLAYCREYVSKWDAKQYVKLHEEALVWTPYVMGRGNTTNFELGPAITAMAPREEEEDRKMVAPPLVNGVSTGVALESQSSVLVPAEIGPAPEKLTPVEGVADEQSALADQVRESTEPHDDPVPAASSTPTQSQAAAGHVSSTAWFEQYEGILASRFEVYPPAGGRRQDRPRASIPRPAIVRTAPLSSSSSAKPRRSAGGGSVKRPSASKPKASGTSRRKSGGTGRGPGRWPKGTKKSDYGNADSGPGLPPAWVQERQRLLAESAKKKGTGAAAHEAAGGEAARVQFEDLVALHGDARVSGAAAPGGDIAYTNIASDIPAVGDE
ncbi:Histone acetyltransferase mst2 like protein [Verticillium longisporum]|nr:Histone acetyltransferase mst2 like protein [Verticillium longisporum]